MDAELDTGQHPRAGDRSRSATSTRGTSSRRSSRPRSASCFPAVLERVERGDPGDPQDESEASYFSFFEPEYAWIDWSRPADEIERQVRAWRFHSPAAGDSRRARRARRRDRPRPPREPRAGRRARDGVRRRHTLDRGDGAGMRPVIGITSYAQEARWGVWHLPAALVPLAYVDAIETRGWSRGRHPAEPRRTSRRRSTRSTAIVFSGGADVDPARYGAEAHPGDGHAADAPRRRRDGAARRPRSSATCRRSRSAAASSC